MADAGGSVRGWVSVLDGEPDDLVLETALVSITGPRPENQDAGIARPTLLAVADGVAGNVGGAIAATLIVDALSEEAQRPGAGSPGERLAGAVGAANGRLGRAVADSPGLAHMATTLTAVALAGHHLVVAHIGDSRAYLLSDGRLEQLTSDQTVVQSLVDAGVITTAQAHTHPFRSILLGALRGADEDLEHLVVTSRPVRPGDRVLVCSDGLSGVVGPEILERVLREEPRPGDAATRLVRDALAAGTRDNVTAVVADVAVVTEQADGDGS